MKYAIIKCINGAFSVDSEHSNVNLAKARFHAVCQTLWNAQDVATAEIVIVDEQLNCVENYREFIHHEAEEETTEG